MICRACNGRGTVLHPTYLTMSRCEVCGGSGTIHSRIGRSYPGKVSFIHGDRGTDTKTRPPENRLAAWWRERRAAFGIIAAVLAIVTYVWWFHGR